MPTQDSSPQPPKGHQTTGPRIEVPEGCVEATFAGGCFWCMEAVFKTKKGIKATLSGYTGGFIENPNYRQVCGGDTGHVEALRIVFDPEEISYPELLDIFWRNIDPGRDDGQFCDTGPQYRPVIFVHDDQQKSQAEQSRRHLEENEVLNGDSILVAITDAMPFYPAEEEHQDYYRKNPVRYALYSRGCGRSQRLREIWGKTITKS